MTNTLITIFGILFTFLMTTLGSTLVYFFKGKPSEKVNTTFLGFASGIMIAASVWSLIIPAMDLSRDWGIWKVVPVVVGFLLGGLFLIFIDKIIPHLHLGNDLEEGSKNNYRKATKLFLAVTIHNIPEGLAVGFAFAAAAVVGTQAAFLSALGLAIGIGIQNFPEGASVALPVQSETGNKNKAFIYGTLSGAVEPVFALMGFFMASIFEIVQPWLLSFAAGAMIFVVAEDLIPDAYIEKNPHFGTWGVMIGFALMMVLEVVLG